MKARRLDARQEVRKRGRAARGRVKQEVKLPRRAVREGDAAVEFSEKRQAGRQAVRYRYSGGERETGSNEGKG